MEVHHHPDLHHRKKRFKEYFLEFLMIFLAVSLGFLAENLREMITSRKKEKEYISGFVRNLQQDTARLHSVIRFDSIQINKIDSFLLLSHADMKMNESRKKFYLMAINTFYSSSSFTSNNSTLQQLNSTGDFRLIEKDHVADSLSKYDADNTIISGQTNYYKEYFKEILSLLDVLGDMSVYDDTMALRTNDFSTKPYPELGGSGTELRMLFNKVLDFKLIINSYAENSLKPQLENATRLIAFLKKEYDIVDE